MEWLINRKIFLSIRPVQKLFQCKKETNSHIFLTQIRKSAFDIMIKVMLVMQK